MPGDKTDIHSSIYAHAHDVATAPAPNRHRAYVVLFIRSRPYRSRAAEHRHLLMFDFGKFLTYSCEKIRHISPGILEYDIPTTL